MVRRWCKAERAQRPWLQRFTDAPSSPATVSERRWQTMIAHVVQPDARGLGMLASWNEAYRIVEQCLHIVLHLQIPLLAFSVFGTELAHIHFPCQPPAVAFLIYICTYIHYSTKTACRQSSESAKAPCRMRGHLRLLTWAALCTIMYVCIYDYIAPRPTTGMRSEEGVATCMP